MAGSVASAVVAFAQFKGVTLDTLAETTGIHSGDLQNSEKLLPDDVASAIWRHLTTQFPNYVLSIEMVGLVSMSLFGPLLDGAQYAQDLRMALKLLELNRAILADRLTVAIDHAGDRPFIMISHPEDTMDIGHGSEVALGLGKRIIDTLIAPTRYLSEAHFTHEPIGSIDDYTTYFQCPVHFKQDRAGFQFAPGALDLATKNADSEMFSFTSKYLESLTDAIDQRYMTQGLMDIATAIENSAIRGRYDLDSIAHMAGLSKRSLQRLADVEGVSLRSEIETARMSTALVLLKDRSKSIDAISFIVGYADECAFRRAFERWTGVSPAQHRKGGF